MTHSAFTRLHPTRRSVLKSAALGSVAAIAAPYVKDSYAAGTLTMGVWDHWVPGANNALTALCSEWGAKNNVEVKIDYITSQGDKDMLTAAAEALAGTGHDIMSHRVWNIRIHAELLEPLDDVAGELVKQYGPMSPVIEYLGKIKGTWRGVSATRGSQVKPCCSRLDLYKEHAGVDLRELFPPDESKWDKAKVDAWSWDAYLVAAEKLFKAGYPVGLPMGQTSDAVDWVGALFNAYGVVMVDAKDNIKINSDETRAALEYLKKLMAVNPPEVYAWDDAGNNRWLISGKGSGIMNPPRPGRSPSVTTRKWRRTAGHTRCRKARRAGSSDSCRSCTACGVSRRTRRPRRSCCSFSRKNQRSPNWSKRRLVTIYPRLQACTTSIPGRPLDRRSAQCTAIHRAATSRPRLPARRRARTSARKSTIRPSIPSWWPSSPKAARSSMTCSSGSRMSSKERCAPERAVGLL
jgi:hypothetical protein